MTDKKINKKYGKIPIQRNWNRMAELSHKFSLNEVEKVEMSYRIEVQNYFACNGKMPEDFIEPK